MTAPVPSVKEVAQDRLKTGARSENDAEREVERTPGADE
jgi:hypothetical protein